RLTRSEVQVSQSRRTKIGAEEVVIHREVLSIVPESSHSVAVVVTHNKTLSQAQIIAPGLRCPIELDKFVHQAPVQGLLFAGVIVTLIADDRLRAIQAERLNRVRI